MIYCEHGSKNALIERDSKDILTRSYTYDFSCVEIETIERKDTWKLTNYLEGGMKTGIKWVYKTKLKNNGEINKYKARLVTKGYTQQHEIYYVEVFTIVAWMVILLFTQNEWLIYLLDMRLTFLYMELSDEVYIEQLFGYE